MTGVPADWLVSGRASPGQTGRIEIGGGLRPANDGGRGGTVAEGSRETLEISQSPLRRDRAGKPFVHQTRWMAAATLGGYVGISRSNAMVLPGVETSLVEHPQIVEHLTFKQDFLRSELKRDSEDLVLVKAADDAMEPTIPRGAILTVGMDPDRRPESGGVYVFRVDDALVARRLEIRLSGTVVLHSDNPGYPPENCCRAKGFEALQRIELVLPVLAPPQKAKRATAAANSGDS